VLEVRLFVSVSKNGKAIQADIAILEGDITDRIKMITTAFSAIASVAGAIHTSQREDLRSVAILLYSG
jgi:hypothetical protein